MVPIENVKMIIGCYDNVSALFRALQMEGNSLLINELMMMDNVSQMSSIYGLFYALPETSELRAWIDRHVDFEDFIREEIEKLHRDLKISDAL